MHQCLKYLEWLISVPLERTAASKMKGKLVSAQDTMKEDIHKPDFREFLTDLGRLDKSKEKPRGPRIMTSCLTAP